MCERERENRGRRVSPRPKPTTTPKCQDQVQVVISVFLRFTHDHALMAVFPLRLSGVSTEVTTLPYACRAFDSARLSPWVSCVFLRLSRCPSSASLGQVVSPRCSARLSAWPNRGLPKASTPGRDGRFGSCMHSATLGRHTKLVSVY